LGGGSAEALMLDLADVGMAEATVAKTVGQLANLRWAGVMAAAELGPTGPLERNDLVVWGRIFAVNVTGNLAVARALLPSMYRSQFGRLVFFSGGGAAYAYPLAPAYACTKVALVRAVENLHEDLKERGNFSVVCLAPGAVETDLLARVRAAGAEVRTNTAVDETVTFVERFLEADGRGLSGRFIHVRDDWAAVLEGRHLDPDQWMLRRRE
jgi:NAD(P)-dependent dehydrogenase (short-subunit alcohol dehydrogenase family)